MRLERLALALIFLAACQQEPSEPESLAAPAAMPTQRASTPVPQAEELRTTSGSIAIGNLTSQIDGLERLAARRPLTVRQRTMLVELMLMRGQYTSRVADYERATTLADELVRNFPADPKAFLARAHTRAKLHKFDRALRDLETVEQLGKSRLRTDSERAGILQATGQYDEALIIHQQLAEEWPNIRTLGALGVLHAERGETDKAARLFAAALESYRDVSPFPVTWLLFEEGRMWVRHGDLRRARDRFAEAHRRLPAYAAAQGHLAEVEAELGRPQVAIALLRPLAERSDDPDYASQLARILGETGRTDEAARWRDVAAKRHEELVVQYPEAFSDHAVEFWLAAGGDPEKALTLAERNLAVRRTPRAYELVLSAGLAVGEGAIPCDTVESAKPLQRFSPALPQLITQAAAACNSGAGSPIPSQSMSGCTNAEHGYNAVCCWWVRWVSNPNDRSPRFH